MIEVALNRMIRTHVPQTPEMPERRIAVRSCTIASWGGHAPPRNRDRRGTVLVLSLLLALLVNVSPTARAKDVWDTADLPVAINLGADSSYARSDGLLFLADQQWQPGSYGYVDGTPDKIPSASPIAGALTQTLYQSRLKRWSTYRIDRVPDGSYSVVLHFAEVRAQGSGQVVFDLSIEGDRVLEGIDLFETVGLNRAYVRRFLVEVKDGTLDITADAIVGSTHMAAIELHPVEHGENPLARPQDSKATPSFDAVILTWMESTNPTIDGYHIYRSPNLDGPFKRITNQPVAGAFFIDQFPGLPPDQRPGLDLWRYQLSTVDLFGNESALTPAIAARPLVPADADLPVYELEISVENLAVLQSDVLSDVEVPALVKHKGQRYPVQVRFRGHAARDYPKKSWKIIFPAESPIAPRDRLNLRAQFEDPSLLRAGLTGGLYEDADIQPPLSRPALLFVNGEYAGLYDDAEQVDRQFLERTGRSADASIYAAKWTQYGNWSSLLDSVEEYHSAFRKESNSGTGYGDLIAFFEMINGSDERSIASHLATRLDVKRFIDYYAVIVLTQNMDFTRHNVFLIHNLETDLWEVVPWDPDYTWGVIGKFSSQRGHDKPIDMGTAKSPDTFNGPNVLLTRVLEVPQYRSYYCSRLQQLAENVMSEERIASIVDDSYLQVRDAGRGDWHKFGGEHNDLFDAEPERLKRWSKERRNFLLGELNEYCDVEGTFLSINEVMPGNVGSICDPDDPDPSDCYEPWIEIFNAGLDSASLEGLFLAADDQGSQAVRITHPIRVPPLGYTIIWLDGETGQGANHIDLQVSSLGGSVSLIGRDGQTLIDRLAYEQTPPDRSWGRFPDAAEVSNLLTVASPYSRNRSGPYIAVTEPTAMYSPADTPIHFAAEIDDDGSVEEVILHYSVNNQPNQTVQMPRTRYGLYEADLPSLPSGSLVKYAIAASDDEGLSSRSPSQDPDDVHVITVGFHQPTVRISRFSVPASSSNASNPVGWIELHNYGTEPVNLDRMYLSNQPDDPIMFLIQSDIIMAPDDYFVFEADGKTEIGPTHTNFVLDPAGGVVALFDANSRFNRLIDQQRYGDEITGGGNYACRVGGTTWITSAPTSALNDEVLICRSIFLPMVR